MIAYGRNTVIEALSSNFDVNEVFLQEDIKNDEKIDKIISLSKKRGSKINHLHHKKISKLVNNDEHQGVACKVDFKEFKLREILSKNLNKTNSFIYISQATYEHNIGAIIRTAECAGLMGVILPANLDVTATIAKISTGAIFHIPIIKQSIFQIIKELKNNNFNIIGIERNGKLINETNLEGNNLFIIGGEDKSLTEQIRNLCDLIIEIPQFGKVNSLNMSVASGIVIYEYVRQKLSANNKS